SGGTTQYDKIALSPVKKGEWTKVENPSYTIPEGAENIKFYIEVPDDLSDFYVDDIRITGSASSAPSGPSTPSTPSTTVNAEKTTGKIKGDLDGDGMITSLDVVLMRKRLLSGFTDSKMKKAADIDRSGDTEIADLVQLQRFILGRIAQFEEVADPVNYDEPVEYEKSYNFPAVNKLPSSKDIPDPFIFMDGSKVESESDWWKRQAEISCMYEYYMYGKWIDGSDDETSYKINGNKMTITVKRKSTGKTASFDMVINRPKSVRHEGGAPVILGMHKGIAESTATSNGYAVITYDADGMFSAPGTAQDNNQHKGAFYDLYPYGNSFETQTGELMAWSWGLSRTLDALYAGAAKELNINPENAICTGVSRYGKATAVCGAFEKRFKMCAPSCSGAGGIALYRYRSQGKTYDFSSKGASSNYTYTENEPLGSLQASGEQAWFNGNFMQFRDVNNLPMDQHMLGSLCCDPDRYLFIIGSCVGEDWVNAPSMWMSYCGMRPIWDYVGLSDHLAINIHKEGHAVIAEDVEKMIQYFDYHVYGINPKMDLKELQTSVFDLPKNKDPFQDTLSSKWIH
ncbi:MAG TPA: dockerin type I repeat-containing protein, partial [Ruminococcus flavefaciens]|nr:dockerin type I repeat-containing protein [Ruminococcus flavefaciens]